MGLAAPPPGPRRWPHNRVKPGAPGRIDAKGHKFARLLVF